MPTPLMKKQTVVNHTIRQNYVPVLLYSVVTNTSPVKILCPRKKKFPSLHFFKKKHNILK